MKQIFIGIIRFYQKFISPMTPPTCRFYPTCSHYGLEAFQKHGIQRFWLTCKRILKCHPFHPGGFDPVPDKRMTKYILNFRNHSQLNLIFLYQDR